MLSHSRTCVLLILSVLAAGAAFAEPVREGETVRINYLCRLSNGELASSTLGESKLSVESKRSAIFQPIQNDAPLVLPAGKIATASGMKADQDFADEIAAQLARAVVGREPGDQFELTVSALQAKSRDDAMLTLAKVRRRTRELRMAGVEYEERTGKKAEIGQPFNIDPSFPGEVVSVEEGGVTIRFRPPAGNILSTPFGSAVIQETDHEYLVDIDARVGALVRSGPMVGRIVKVDEKTFVVDFGHPLAGQDLACEVTVLPIEQNEKIAGK